LRIEANNRKDLGGFDRITLIVLAVLGFSLFSGAPKSGLKLKNAASHVN